MSRGASEICSKFPEAPFLLWFFKRASFPGLKGHGSLTQQNSSRSCFYYEVGCSRTKHHVTHTHSYLQPNEYVLNDSRMNYKKLISTVNPLADTYQSLQGRFTFMTEAAGIGLYLGRIYSGLISCSQVVVLV